MSSIEALRRKIDRMIERLDNDTPTEIEFKCYWGDEEIPDEGKPGVVIFRTEWGSFRLDDEEWEESA